MAIRHYKKISELDAITSASLSTYVAGVDNGETVRITLDVLADGVRNTINTIDIQRLNALEAATSSYLTSLNGTISGSSQLTSSYDGRYVLSGSISQTTWDNISGKPLGLVSQSIDVSLLNNFTSSQQILNVAFTNGVNARLQTSSFNEFSQSYRNDSSSFDSRLDILEGYVDVDNYVTTSSFNNYTASISTASLVDRLSNLENSTSSYETTGRGILSGSISYETLTNIPQGIVSQSVDIANFVFTTDTITNGAITLHATNADIVLNADGNVYKGSANAGNGLVTDGLLDVIIGDTARINTGTGHSITDNLDNIINSIPSLNSLNSFSSSYFTDSASFNNRIIAATNEQSLSHLITTSSFNTYTASISTGSLVNRLNTIESVSGSWITESETSSFATTGSNTFYGNQTFSGSLIPTTASGSFTSSFSLGSPTAAWEHLYVSTGSIKFVNKSGQIVDSISTNGNGINVGSITATNGITGSVNFQNIINVPTLISSSTQITNLGFATTSSTVNVNTSSLVTTASFNSYTASISTASLVTSIVNLNTFTASTATTGSNTFIGTETISGSLLLSGSFNYNGTPLQNGFAFAQPILTKILDNSSYTGGSSWVGAYTGSGGAIIVTVNVSGFRASTGTGTLSLYRDGVSVASQTFYFNIANYHTPLPPIVYVRNSETGSHTYSIVFSNISADVNDYATINVLEYGNSAILPATLISGSSQLTSSFDIRYAPSASYLTSLNGAYTSSIQTLGGSGVYSSSAQLPSGLISGSSQLTASYDTRYTLSGSVSAVPAGTISGSAQITAFGFVSSSTSVPAGTISGSSQLTSSFDGRYVQTGSFNTLTASFNSFTASAQSVTTGSNSFNGTQIITGSLIITTGSFVGSQILANTSSLYLTSGSNLYLQNSGVVEITGSLIVSGSATFNVSALTINGRGGDEGGEINLAIPVTNTTLQNRVTTDIWQNRFRVFEGSANSKGVFVDLSKAPAGVGGELMWKASGLVNLGVDVTLGDLKARLPSTGNKSLQLSTTSAGVTYSVYGSGIYTQAGSTVGTTINASSPLSVTSTPAYLASGYNFGTAGATDTWVIMDTSNTIAWRITMILGSGFNNNMISIERLV